MNNNLHFRRIAIIGIGLIGSSIARVIRRERISDHIVVCAKSEESRLSSLELGIADSVTEDPREAVKNADLIFLCTPLKTYVEIATLIAPFIDKHAILTDVGSVKGSVIRDLSTILNSDTLFVPAHPVAGTEKSGPDSGFETLFNGHWCIITPCKNSNKESIKTISNFWNSAGSNIEVMDPHHHDLILAVTSHLPHLIAYNIVGTADDLENITNSDVIKFSAGGFRDFTRIAASDPVMWRDIFLSNRDAVMEILSRFNSDLLILQNAISDGDGSMLEKLFSRTRKIRKDILDAGQVEKKSD